MIPEDAGKRMSILERISDEPCEPIAYIDDLLSDLHRYRAHWAQAPSVMPEGAPSTTDCMLLQIDLQIGILEDVRRKIAWVGRRGGPRPRSEPMATLAELEPVVTAALLELLDSPDRTDLDEHLRRLGILRRLAASAYDLGCSLRG